LDVPFFGDLGLQWDDDRVPARRVRPIAVHLGDVLTGGIISAGVLAVWSWVSLWHLVNTVEGAAVVALVLPAMVVIASVGWLAQRRLPWIAAGLAAGAVPGLLTVSLILVFSHQMANFD